MSDNVTPEQRLAELPEHMRTREWIESEIVHEAGPHPRCGELCVHTYHACACGRGACRSVMCAPCWRELLPLAT